MKDGFLWWNKAFEAAGFKNALEIRDMPPGMDPMDVRYNQIYWVDRDERGYSTGGGLTDPRTGEIIAARVRLESDRVRTMSRYWQSYRAGRRRRQFRRSPAGVLHAGDRTAVGLAAAGSADRA